MAIAALLVAGCQHDGVPDVQPRPDLSIVFHPVDLAFEVIEEDLAPAEETFTVEYGPPDRAFPLRTDPNTPVDPLERDNGVVRNLDGYLEGDNPYRAFGFLWIANTHDLGDAGTISKLDNKTVREVARYLTVTCSSLKTGGKQACDGVNGCCAIDDEARWQARRNKQPEPGHQAVQRGGNFPSRTAVDFNGDLYVANRAPGGQASVTLISPTPTTCVDRNGNQRIDSSSDVSGNGYIEVDCNGDGAPDDIASVLARPCTNGKAQEFYGLDDECVLWTSNVLPVGADLRALGLSGGDSAFSSIWAGGYATGSFRRLEGVHGLADNELTLPGDCTRNGNGPNGLAVDANGIAWAPNLGSGKLCYFDTRKPGVNLGVARDPQWGPMVGDGLTLDRDQNVWMGQDVARYMPDRTNGFANLGSGWWTRAGGLTGTRIVADSRNVNTYFVWSCTQSGVVQVPASTFARVKMDQQVVNPGWPAIKMPCLGVAMDGDQDIWGIDARLATRALVDKFGAITQPKVNGAPMGMNKCPAGDSCPTPGDAEVYSDLASFSFFNGTRPASSYDLLVRGCVDAQGNAADTDWIAVEWDGDVPPNTSLLVQAKTANGGAFNDPSWSNALWTPSVPISPLELRETLLGNWHPGEHDVLDGWLWVEVTFKTWSTVATARLKHLRVRYGCPR